MRTAGRSSRQDALGQDGRIKYIKQLLCDWCCEMVGELQHRSITIYTDLDRLLGLLCSVALQDIVYFVTGAVVEPLRIEQRTYLR